MDILFPVSVKGQRITATGASAFTQFTAGDKRNAAAVSTVMMVANPGAVGVHIISGRFAAPPTADNTCMYIPPNTTRAFRKPQDHDGVALLSSGANQDIIVYHSLGS